MLLVAKIIYLFFIIAFIVKMYKTIIRDDSNLVEVKVVRKVKRKLKDKSTEYVMYCTYIENGLKHTIKVLDDYLPAKGSKIKIRKIGDSSGVQVPSKLYVCAMTSIVLLGLPTAALLVSSFILV